MLTNNIKDIDGLVNQKLSKKYPGRIIIGLNVIVAPFFGFC
jgi:hypothetical protein